MKEQEGMQELIERLHKETDTTTSEVEFLILRLRQWGVERIFDDRVRKSIVNYYLAKVPYQFFVGLPPTNKGRHSFWHYGSGGLLVHIIESCVFIEGFLNSFGAFDSNWTLRPEPEYHELRDIVLSATLLSDTQKYGIPWGEKRVSNHGELAAEEWCMVAFGCDVDKDLREKIMHGTTCHYGRFTPLEEPKEIWDFPDYVQIIHFADCISAIAPLFAVFEPKKNILPPPD